MSRHRRRSIALGLAGVALALFALGRMAEGGQGRIAVRFSCSALSQAMLGLRPVVRQTVAF